jgi:hypothetical protein
MIDRAGELVPIHARPTTDTSPEADRVHLDVLRRMGLQGRARLTFALGDSLRSLTESGVRHRHPDYDERRVRLATARLLLGESLFAQVFPREDVRP